MTWDEIKALTCVDFLTWLDRDRERLLDRLRSTRMPASDLDLYESWGEILSWVYAKGATADCWNSRGHLQAWCIGWLWRSVPHLFSKRCKSRCKQEGGRVVYEQFVTELADEAFEKFNATPVVLRESKPDQLGPSEEGWFTQALNDLTPRRRQAIQLCVLEGYSVNDAADLVGCTKNAMNKARYNALKSLRFAFEGRAYRTINGYIVEIEEAA